jgi:ubiquinone/menaquinone biosynthesis C-methylase UbiE
MRVPSTRSPAEIYDELFVPALFRQWGGVVAAAADLRAGQRVLDVACGTGVLALAAAERVRESGRVTGLDANGDMLAVARRKSDRVEWREGRAEALPFPDASFDAVLSQFGLMFFADRVGGLREMMRVLRPGGQLAVAVWGSLESSPGYGSLAELLQRLFGDRVAQAFGAPFALGDPERLLALCAEADIRDAQVVQRSGTVRFPSIEALVAAEEACVWTLGGLLDERQCARLLEAARDALRPFVDVSGEIAFELPALVCLTRRPRSSA